ncbi:hypothetical protein ACUN7V_08040 [Quadrisphaera oryzae]|uniref:hypothetical protein n=1 Tax=Quadrisphaera TaxID=317661 RepID=UPI0016456DA4|nr:hypothetical protein [Quadrisphaera sp. RL12-1S]MBC3761664.1 hypothetical protein [Quadrisphaera sp. RL12-1S]
MPLTVEAERRAVACVLDLVEEGTVTRVAVRRVASQVGVPARRLERWVRLRVPAGGGSPGAASPPGRGRVGVVRTGLAAVAVLGVGADAVVRFPVTTASVAALLLLPVWAAQLRRYRGATALVVLGLLALAAGAWLAVSSTTHRFDSSDAIATTVLVLTALGSLGVLLWARAVLPLRAVALLAGTGMLAAGVLSSPTANPWKYQLSMPVTTIALALVVGRSPVVGAAVSLFLAVVGFANDSRSYAGFAVLTAAVMLWQALPARRAGEHRSGWHRAGMAASITTGVCAAYTIATSLLVSGALGEAVQQRSQAQVASGGGSLIAGGRPEMMATRFLAPHHPWGFGLGAIPNQEDVLLAKEGLATVGIRPDNGYVDHYMFGGHFKLHSVLSDAWANMGLVGALFVLAVGFVAVDSLLTGLAARRATALGVFWVSSAVWYIGFGPMYSNLPDLVLAVALVAVPRAQARRGRQAQRVRPQPAARVSAAATSAR